MKKKLLCVLWVGVFTMCVIGTMITTALLVYIDIKNKEYHLRIDFLDVGQGDAILITTPSQRQILVDGGRDARILYELSRSMRWWDRKIDVVIATHPDADHIGGLVEVLRRYKIENLVDYGYGRDQVLERSYFSAIDNKTHHQVTRRITIDMGDGVFIDSYSMMIDGQTTEKNDQSHMSILRYGDMSLVLTGDASVDEERWLVNEGIILATKTRFLKAGHHGSTTSSSLELLQGFTPHLTVYSAGRGNRYGHPAPEVVNRYKELGLPTLCTCDVGRVSIITDGQSWRVETDHDFEIDDMNIYPIE